MEDDMIPVLGSVSFEVDSEEALEELIQGLQEQAAFSYCFLSAEMNNKPYVGTVIHTLKELDDVGKKLSKTYLVKAARIYHEHLNDFNVQKSQKEYIQESELASHMIYFVAELNHDMRLCKQNKLTYAYPCDSKNVIVTMVINSFPRSTVEFVNESVADAFLFIEQNKRLGIGERKTLKEIFGAQER